MNDEEKFLKVWNDPALFSYNFMEIQDKNDELVPFKFNKLQRDFMENMSRYNIILKSRQLGFSVMICAYAIWLAITTPNSNCLMLSYNDESKRAIFNKLKQIYKSIPEEVKPKLLRNNRSELQMENGSIISCSPMGNVDKGRGNTCSLIWISEFAFVKSDVAEKQILSLEQALNSKGKLIIETTANGLNFFHGMYIKSKRKENFYKSFFYNYLDGKEMFLEQYEEARDTWKNLHNNVPFSEKDLKDDEKELLKNYPNMTLDVLCWRRLKIENSSEDKFNQEYPISDDVAFISTGASVFDNKRVSTVLQSILLNKTKYLKKLEIEDLPQELEKFYGRSFFMYKSPTPKAKYYIGVDTAEGTKKDSSTCIVLAEEGEEVAMFKNNAIKPWQFAEFVNILGRYYNKAYLVVEKMSGGHSVIERLRYEKQYLNMHKYKSYDEFNRIVYNIGFDTKSKTKSLVINDLREMFEKGQLLLHSAEILEEMKVFEISDNGSMGAMSGYHDDLVMALALAIVGLKSHIYYAW
ncbi:terminase large subunit domain-containing protein [Clostridium beijerinckii]|jgi:hypothetical protein|uniref:Terminase large subunit gp17-like C-terminal domain-containing protein n=2 Tax=Clostridium beijerinckii TaxID=1520 RepID=A0AAE2RWX6_CLOBE|nr:terminase family protein [Clostridium beijerinckii]ABR33540.1 conserved hypothetical protein [Clostridium beijerinckii NCIMB 8052]AIU01489.1 hypothetical protein Cbs_1360 [Clostridium beijerinckii ATCC 35702]MBF7811956.1 hypothetical protein [Clostridium beijerinckii]NRT25193.1 hypothetical protein [Clostridium beijerinckii]NRT67213.1 hypothetical protein [Clostridium beijerinckii]